MKTVRVVLFFVVGMVLFSSCSRQLRPFTDYVYEDFGSSERELSKIQFYLSHDIVLYRDVKGSQYRVENGVIKLVDGRKVEEVVFKKGLPGVFVFSPKSERLAVSFEDNNDHYLMFGVNRNAGGRFVLLAKEWNNRRGRVTYAGKTWNTKGNSAYANLLVDVNRIQNVNFKKKRVSGRKVN